MELCNNGTDVRLRGYVDSDFVGDIDNQRSTIDISTGYVLFGTGYVFTLGSGAVS